MWATVRRYEGVNDPDEVAKRVRDLAGLNPPGGPLVDDIIYAAVDGPSVFAHPLCPATKRNGVALGDEAP